MGLFSILKRNSKLALRGSWGRAIIIFLVVIGVSTLITALTQVAIGVFAADSLFASADAEQYDAFAAIAREFRLSVAEWVIFGASTVLSVLLIAPLTLGQARWYYNLVHGKSLPASEMFYYFETGRTYMRSVVYEINIGIRSMLWMVLFFSVPTAVFGVSFFFLSGEYELSRAGQMTATSGMLLSLVLYLIATLFYSACVCRYTLTPYLMAEDPGLTVRKAIKFSVRYTRGFRFSILWFELSYIGWFLLSAFFFPLLYVAPYHSTGVAMYSRFIIEKKRNPVSGATQEFSAGCEERGLSEAPEEHGETHENKT